MLLFPLPVPLPDATNPESRVGQQEDLSMDKLATLADDIMLSQTTINNLMAEATWSTCRRMCSLYARQQPLRARNLPPPPPRRSPPQARSPSRSCACFTTGLARRLSPVSRPAPSGPREMATGGSPRTSSQFLDGCDATSLIIPECLACMASYHCKSSE